MAVMVPNAASYYATDASVKFARHSSSSVDMIEVCVFIDVLKQHNTCGFDQACSL